MPRILDLIAERRARFVPEDWRQYVALQLARRMRALEYIDAFITVMEKQPFEDVAVQCRRVSDLPPDRAHKAFLSAFHLDH